MIDLSGEQRALGNRTDKQLMDECVHFSLMSVDNIKGFLQKHGLQSFISTKRPALNKAMEGKINFVRNGINCEMQILGINDIQR